MKSQNLLALTMLGSLLLINLFILSASSRQDPILGAYAFTTFATILYASFFVRLLSTSFFFLTFFLMLFFTEPILYYLTGQEFPRSIYSVQSYGLLTLCALPLFLIGHALIPQNKGSRCHDIINPAIK